MSAWASMIGIGISSGGLVAGVADHQPLVAGAAGVDALGDVRRLPADRVEDAAGRVVEAVLGVGVADVADQRCAPAPGTSTQPSVVISPPTIDQADGDEALAGDAAGPALGWPASACGRLDPAEHLVEHRVGDLVAHLVRVPLGHRLRREDVTSSTIHWISSCAPARVSPGRRCCRRRQTLPQTEDVRERDVSRLACRPDSGITRKCQQRARPLPQPADLEPVDARSLVW